MGETRRLLRNTGIIAVGSMATKVVSFFLLPLYTSVLSTTEYGTVDYVTSLSVFLVPVATMLMDEAVFRFLIDCEGEGDRKSVISTALTVCLAGTLALMAVAVPVLALLRYEYSTLLVLYILASSALTMMSALLRGLGRTSAYAVMNFLASLMTILLNVLFLVGLRLGVAGMLLATILAQLAVPAGFAVSIRLWREVSPKAFSRRLAAEMLRYAAPLIPNRVSWTIMNLSDRLIIMNAIGASASGLYAVSYKFPNAMDMVYGFFYMSWKESSARALGSDEDEAAFYNAVYDKLRRFMMSVVIGMTAFMPPVYVVLVDSSYAEGMLYVPVLLLATYYSNMSGFYGGIFTAYKDTRVMGTTTIVAAVLNLVLNFVLIPFLGLWGSSLATLASTLLVNEYRKRKVGVYVALAENGRWAACSYAVLAAVLAAYYLYYDRGGAILLAAMIALAGVYFLVSNREVLRALLARFGGGKAHA